MSLLKLLKAGKSLVGATEACKYRVTRHQLLPKFATKPNPFRATALPEPLTPGQSAPEPEAKADALAALVSANVTGTPAPAAATDGSPERPAALSAGPMRVATGEAGTGRDGWGRRYAAGLRSLLAGRPAAPAPTPAKRATRRLVQAELSLDRVKVMRNDLSDSDLEVVRSKPLPAAAPGSPMNAEAGGTVWGRVTARFFDVGKV